MGPRAAENRFLSASPVSSDVWDINAVTCDTNIKEVRMNCTEKLED